jgi:hypothetical protein
MIFSTQIPQLPTIDVSAPLEEVLYRAENALIAFGEARDAEIKQDHADLDVVTSSLYQCAGRIVHVVRQTTDIANIVEAPAHLIHALLHSSATFRRTVNKGDNVVQVPAEPSMDIAKKLQALGQWRLPFINGVAGTPMMRTDGSLIETPGYDLASGYVYVPSADFPPIDTSYVGVMNAVELLRQPFAEFPFVDAASRAAVIAAILSGLARAAFPFAPMFLLRASHPGSGKTLVANAVSIIVTGRPAMCLSPVNDDAELERVLAAVAASGERVAVLDNLTNEYKSPVLARVMTSTNVASRVIGTSTVPRWPWKAILFLTGNNVTLKGELIRRTVLCEIDPRMGHPERRSFAIPDLLAWISARRPELVCAGLTILRGYVLAGRRSGLAPMGSFEEWGRLIRGAVVWAGFGDPLANVDALGVEQSEDDQALYEVLVAIRKQFGEKEFIVKDVLEMVGKDGAFADTMCLWRELSPVTRCELTARMVGDGLRYDKNRVVRGLCVRRCGIANGHVKWRVEEVG